MIDKLHAFAAASGILVPAPAAAPVNLLLPSKASTAARLFGPGYTPPSAADAYVGDSIANVAVNNLFSSTLQAHAAQLSTGSAVPTVQAAQFAAAPNYSSGLQPVGPTGLAPSTKLAIGVALGAVGLVGLVALMRRGS